MINEAARKRAQIGRACGGFSRLAFSGVASGFSTAAATASFSAPGAVFQPPVARARSAACAVRARILRLGLGGAVAGGLCVLAALVLLRRVAGLLRVVGLVRLIRPIGLVAGRLRLLGLVAARRRVLLRRESLELLVELALDLGELRG